MTVEELPGKWQLRSYGDGCAVAHALDLIGERWALLIVRELLFGPKRFSELRTGLPPASPNILTQRLSELAETGIIDRHKADPPVRGWVYELTDRGRTLEPILLELRHWGSRSPYFDPDADLSADSLLLALKSRYDPARAPNLTATAAVILDDDTFAVRVSAGRLEITRGLPRRPDLTLYTDVPTFRSLVLHRRRSEHMTVIDPQKLLGRLLHALG